MTNRVGVDNIGGVIFDLDGTLLNTLSDIANATNAVLAQHGFPQHPIDHYRLLIGEGMERLLRRALPQSHRDQQTIKLCLITMHEEYRRNLNKTAVPYDCIKEMLQELSQLGLRLGVLSNKTDEYTQECVTRFFGSTIFNPVIGLRPGLPRKPNPAGAFSIARQWNLSPGQILYLGDSGSDMETTKAAGMIAAGAEWGFRSPQELRQHGADLLLASPPELPVLLRRSTSS